MPGNRAYYSNEAQFELAMCLFAKQTYGKRGVLALEEIRERLTELIKMLPEDKLQVLLEFANRLYNEYQEGDDSDDELLMTD